MKLHRGCLGFQTEIDWDTVPFDVSRQLGRWKIAGLFGRENERRRANAIPLLHQPIRRPRELVDYIEEWVIGGEGMPRMTGALAKETRRAFCEVFGNVFRHAESLPGGIAVGQLYPIVKRFQLCVCDAGVGMVHRVQGAGFARE